MEKRIKNKLWITKESEQYTIGMSKELQDEIGEIGFAELAPVGKISAGSRLAALEASKMVVEIACPLSGSIVARNEETLDHPECLNEDESHKNWLVKLTAVDNQEFEACSPYEDNEKKDDNV